MKEYKIKFTGDGWKDLDTTALFDPNIGLTILDPDDPNKPIFCWHGPSSVVGKRLHPEEQIWQHAMLGWRVKIFKEFLESGRFNLGEYKRCKHARYGPSQGVQEAPCPFIGAQ